jgi:hypothetical protein
LWQPTGPNKRNVITSDKAKEFWSLVFDVSLELGAWILVLCLMLFMFQK